MTGWIVGLGGDLTSIISTYPARLVWDNVFFFGFWGFRHDPLGLPIVSRIAIKVTLASVGFLLIRALPFADNF